MADNNVHNENTDEPNSESLSAESNTDFEESSDGFDRSAFTAAASFALLIICLSLIFYALNLNAKIEDRESIISEQKNEITNLEKKLQDKEELLAVLQGRELDWVILAGLDVNPNGYGKVIWDVKSRQALLQVSGLPQLPADKDYRLWLMNSGNPQSVVAFTVDSTGQAFVKVKQIPEIDKTSTHSFVITPEPKDVMRQPTGELYLLGKVN